MLFFVRRRSNSQRKVLISFNKIVQNLKDFGSSSLETKKGNFARIHELTLPFFGHNYTDTIESQLPTKSLIDYTHIKNLIIKLSRITSSENPESNRMTILNNTYSFRNTMQKSEMSHSNCVKSPFAEERNAHNNRLSHFTHRAYTRRNYIQEKSYMNSNASSVLVKKITHYQKLAFSLRFRKASLPASFRYVNKNKDKSVITNFPFKRAKLLRFYFKKI